MLRTTTARLAIALMIAGALSVPAPARAGDDAKLNGKWQIVKMRRGNKTFPAPKGAKMIMRFKSSNHTWVFSITIPKKGTKREEGIWTLKGDLLTTSKKGRKGKVEKIRVKFRGGKKLELRKGGEVLYLKRV